MQPNNPNSSGFILSIDYPQVTTTSHLKNEILIALDKGISVTHAFRLLIKSFTTIDILKISTGQKLLESYNQTVHACIGINC